MNVDFNIIISYLEMYAVLLFIMIAICIFDSWNNWKNGKR